MMFALWLAFASVVTGSLSLDLSTASSFVTPYTSSFSGVSTVVLSSNSVFESSVFSTSHPAPSFSVRSTDPSFVHSTFDQSIVYSALNPSFSFESITPSSFSFAPPPESRVTLEVDMTIQNESVDTFSSLKQLNLRLAFAILLKIEAEWIRIQSVTNVDVSAFLVSFATASGVDVLLGIELEPGMDVVQHMRAVEALFSDGSLASYLEQLGTPMQLELNRVGLEGEGGDEDDYSNEESGSTTGSESGTEYEHIKRIPSPAAVIVGTTVGFAVFFSLVVCAAKQRRTKIPVLNRMFTRIVPDAPAMK